MARLRTFVAVSLDDKVRQQLVSIQEHFALYCDDVNWVESENLHVTLVFLGEVSDRDLLDVCKVVADAADQVPTFSLQATGVGCFGNPRRPRTLWAGIGAGSEELQTLHTLMTPPLLELGCYRREERIYQPHITLGRVKSESPQEGLANELKRYTNWQGARQIVRELQVLSSELARSGPTYTVLSRAKLG